VHFSPHRVKTLDTQLSTNDAALLADRLTVAVVIPARNRRELTLQCLRSLSRADVSGLDIRILVVDDGSTDGTAEAIRTAFPDVTILTGDGELWWAGAVDKGIRHALENLSPRYLLLLNDDTVSDRNFLVSMVGTAELNPRSVVGGLLLLWTEPHRVFQVAPKWETFSGGWRQLTQQTIWTVPTHPFEVEIIVGNCMLVPAEAIRECGSFATEWLPHFGDAEFTPRLRKKGWRLLIDPQARIFNQPNESPAKLANMSLRDLYSVVWKKYNHAHNLRNRFVTYWLGAPNRLKGITAFAIYVTRLGLQAAGMKFHRHPERPLREEYQ
jgi:GT2 family glycosyltransferase